MCNNTAKELVLVCTVKLVLSVESRLITSIAESKTDLIGRNCGRVVMGALNLTFSQ